MLFALALTFTRYLDIGAETADFGTLLHTYAIGVLPWYVAAPIIVLAAFNQMAAERSLPAILLETLVLVFAVGALHVISLTFFMAPHLDTTISVLLPSFGFRDWFWDIVVFLVALLSGHLWGAVYRRQTAAGMANGEARIMARSPSRVDIVAISDVIAASAQGNYVALITDNAEFLHRVTLAEIKAQLAQHGFVQVHRSHLVRATAIASVKRSDGRIREVRTHNGKRFPVSAAKQDIVTSMLNDDELAA